MMTPRHEESDAPKAIQSFYYLLQAIIAIGACIVGLFLTFETKVEAQRDKDTFDQMHAEIKKTLDEVNQTVRLLYDKQLSREQKDRDQDEFKANGMIRKR